LLEKIELQTISELIKTLNYYQILKLSNLASDAEIQDAFHHEALEFHPDQYFSEEDAEIAELAKQIYAKVVEAYHVLSNRQMRLKYDAKITGIDLIEDYDDTDENSITAVKHRPEWSSSSPGDKFYKLAAKAYQSGDYRSAYMNIQIALGTEPSNPKYRQLKEKVAPHIEQKKTKKKKKD